MGRFRDLTDQKFGRLTVLYRLYPKYKDYGARGIKICQEWLDDFMNFYNWDIKRALELEKGNA